MCVQKVFLTKSVRGTLFDFELLSAFHSDLSVNLEFSVAKPRSEQSGQAGWALALALNSFVLSFYV